MAVRLSRVEAEELFCYVLPAMETDFGISFASDAFQNCLTVGDVFDVAWAQLPAAGKSGNKCTTQMAFYRLRAALGNGDLKPDTCLSDIHRFRYDRLERTLEGQAWRAPRRKFVAGTWWGAIVVGLITGLAFAQVVPVDMAIATAVIAAIAAIIPLHTRVFTAGGPKAATLGQLARDFADVNIGKLCRQGARFNRGLLWQRFVDALSCSVEGGPVVRESGFY